MTELRSKIDVHDYDYKNIVFLAEMLIAKLEKNKLKKEDRELLICAISLILEIRQNQF